MRTIKAVIITILLVLLMPYPVLAANPSVTMTVTAQVTGGVAGFTIYYISDTQLDFSWVLTDNATAMMVRGKYGGFPDNILSDNETPSDGYLVYYGGGTTASDTTMDFNQNPGPIYYRAWAQIADGSWFMTPEEGSEESTKMLLLFLGMIPLGLTVAMFLSKNSMLGYPCGIFWAVLGGYAYMQTAGFFPPEDMYAFLGIACLFGMLPFTIFAAFALRTKREEFAEGDIYIDEGKDDEVFIDESAPPSKMREYYNEYGDPRPRLARNRNSTEEVTTTDRAQGIRERAEARRRKYAH